MEVASGQGKFGRHPNILRFIKVFEETDTISMIFDVCQFELTEKLMSTAVVSEAVIIQLVRPMLLALAHCHTHGKCVSTHTDLNNMTVLACMCPVSSSQQRCFFLRSASLICILYNL